MVLRRDGEVRRLHEQARQGHHGTGSHRALCQSYRGAQDVVVALDRVLKIAEAIKASWAGRPENATKELYREHDGVLARVTGESTASYVSRRRRWYKSLTTHDKPFRIPEHLQLEMMIDCASITDHMKQPVRLAATKPFTLETMGVSSLLVRLQRGTRSTKRC